MQHDHIWWHYSTNNVLCILLSSFLRLIFWCRSCGYFKCKERSRSACGGRCRRMTRARPIHPTSCLPLPPSPPSRHIHNITTHSLALSRAAWSLPVLKSFAEQQRRRQQLARGGGRGGGGVTYDRDGEAGAIRCERRGMAKERGREGERVRVRHPDKQVR